MKYFAKKVYASATIGLLVLIVCAVACKVFVSKLLTIQQVTITIDQSISPQTTQEIKNSIDFITGFYQNNTLPNNNNNNNHSLWHAADISHQLRAQFPCIKAVTITHAPGNSTHITIVAHTPQFCIKTENIDSTKIYDDTETIAATNGTLIPKKNFIATITDSLRTIAIPLPAKNNERLPTSCQQCLANMPPDTFNQYNFAWENSSQIWLHDKQQKNFSILFSQQSLPSQPLLHACATIKNNIIEHKNFNNNKNNRTHWIADIRFNNQIVVFTQKGG